jgi:hypothetical protein
MHELRRRPNWPSNKINSNVVANQKYIDKYKISKVAKHYVVFYLIENNVQTERINQLACLCTYGC